MQEDVCLLVIYNHRYDANIKKINRIYQTRFKNIYHIMPFYDGNEENVIPVYECSFRFEGYLAQAMQRIKEEYSYYFWIADDIVLNPEISENNYKQWFGLNGENAFLPFVKSIHEMGAWSINREFMDPMPKLEWYKGTIWQDSIISSKEAFEIAECLGYEKEDFCVDLPMVWKARNKLGQYPRLFVLFFKTVFLGKQYCPYPIWGGYSDITIIPGDKMREVGHMLGVFAAMGLFVEMAIPTATMLICKNIVQEKDLEAKPLVMWSNEDRMAIEEKYNHDFTKMIKEWDKSCLYIHPVKLSGWKNIE